MDAHSFNDRETQTVVTALVSIVCEKVRTQNLLFVLSLKREKQQHKMPELYTRSQWEPSIKATAWGVFCVQLVGGWAEEINIQNIVNTLLEQKS